MNPPLFQRVDDELFYDGVERCVFLLKVGDRVLQFGDLLLRSQVRGYILGILRGLQPDLEVRLDAGFEIGREGCLQTVGIIGEYQFRLTVLVLALTLGDVAVKDHSAGCAVMRGQDFDFEFAAGLDIAFGSHFGLPP